MIGPAVSSAELGPKGVYKFLLSDHYELDPNRLPGQVRALVDPVPDHRSVFIEARSLGELAGFAHLIIPDDSESKSAEFLFRYVFPDHRRKHLGAELRQQVYKFCQENPNICYLDSGINRVLKIVGGQLVLNHAKLDGSNLEDFGGFASYKSLADTPFKNGGYPIHKIVETRYVDSAFNFQFQTILRENGELKFSPSLTLPDTLDGLINYLKENVLPLDYDLQRLVNIRVASFKGRKEIL